MRGGRDPVVVGDVGGTEVVHLVVEDDPGRRRHYFRTKTEQQGQQDLQKWNHAVGRV